jgi:hypothetical protein
MSAVVQMCSCFRRCSWARLGFAADPMHPTTSFQPSKRLKSSHDPSSFSRERYSICILDTHRHSHLSPDYYFSEDLQGTYLQSLESHPLRSIFIDLLVNIPHLVNQPLLVSERTVSINIHSYFSSLKKHHLWRYLDSRSNRCKYDCGEFEIRSGMIAFNVYFFANLISVVLNRWFICSYS